MAAFLHCVILYKALPLFRNIPLHCTLQGPLFSGSAGPPLSLSPFPHQLPSQSQFQRILSPRHASAQSFTAEFLSLFIDIASAQRVVAMASFSLPSRLISPLRARQLQRAFRNLKLTMICGLLTIVVLRGTLGAGKFGTPAQDFEEIKHQFERVHSTHPHKLASRVLTEVIEERPRPLQAIATQSKLHRKANADATLQETSSDNPRKPYLLGPKISNWDSQRSLKAAAHTGDSTAKIMLVSSSQPSACENPGGDHFLLKYMKNKVDYCRIHGIEIFYNMAVLDAQMSGFWTKLPLLRKLMVSHPEIDWFWWMDSDSVITDMAFKLPLQKYENYSMVMHGWDYLVYEKKDWVGLNTGSFLIRNCQWSLDLLDVWAAMGPEGRVREDAGKLLSKRLRGRPSFEADDQSALVYLLNMEKEAWAKKVYLEHSFYLHGYWKIVVEKYEEIMQKNHNGVGDDRWPFVTHFVGCKPCKKVGSADSDAEQCFKHMERAFNFADNQVLQLYEFEHKSLLSDAVSHIPVSRDHRAEESSHSIQPLTHQSVLVAAQVSTALA